MSRSKLNSLYMLFFAKTHIVFNERKTKFMMFQRLATICKYSKMKLCRNLVFTHCLYTRQNDINVFKGI